MQFEFKKIKTDLIAVAAFLVISLLYCFPLLQGKQFTGSDTMHWMGMSHEAVAYHDSTGKDVMWSNSMFGGMPTYTSYIGAKNTNYPGYIQVALEAVGKPAYFFFIAMLCFYILMRVLKVNKWLALAGAVAYAFSSYNAIIISVGHDTKMLCIGYLPLAFAGLYMIFKEKWLTGAAVFGIGIALMMTNNHYQMMYYTLIIFICYGFVALFTAIKEGRIGKFFVSAAIALVMGAVGAGPSISYFLTTSEYAKETMRGGASELKGHDTKTNGGLDKEYAFSWSSGIGESFCVMIPYLYGGATMEDASKAPKTLEAVGGNAEKLPIYWGDQPTQMGPVFFGAVICFLFVLGLMVVRSPHKWWMLVASVIGFVLAWGKNFPEVNYFLFDHLPMLNKFRTVEMAMVIPQFLFPFLGIWAVQEVIDQKNNTAKLLKDIKIAAAVTGGLCIFIGLASGFLFNFSSAGDSRFPDLLKTLKEDRASLTMTSALKSGALILLAAGLLWAFVKDKIKMTVLIGGLGFLFLVDLLPVSLNYLNSKNFGEKTDANEMFQEALVEGRKKEAYDAVARDKDPYFRILDLSENNPYNDAVQAYFFKCIGGYSPAKMEIYQDLIDRQMSRGFNGQVLNMLNTKYIFVPGGQNAPARVIPNRTACGNAWFVSEVKWAANAEEEMTGLNAANIGDTVVKPGDFDPNKTAVIRNTFKDVMGNYAFSKDSAAYVKLDKYGLDDISFKSSNSKDGLAVFSDIYYAQGWKAFIDGKETPIMRANYVLRTIKIPAGAHNIEFQFRPKSFYSGQTFALISSIALILLAITALVFTFRGSPEPEANR